MALTFSVMSFLYPVCLLFRLLNDLDRPRINLAFLDARSVSFAPGLPIITALGLSSSNRSSAHLLLTAGALPLYDSQPVWWSLKDSVPSPLPWGLHVFVTERASRLIWSNSLHECRNAVPKLSVSNAYPTVYETWVCPCSDNPATIGHPQETMNLTPMVIIGSQNEVCNRIMPNLVQYHCL